MVGDVVGDGAGERNFHLLLTDCCCGNKRLSEQKPLQKLNI